MSDFGEGKVVKVRKDCRCHWCGEGIAKGKEAFWFKGRWNGDWQDWRMHPECEAAYREDDSYDEGFTPFDNPRPEPKIVNAFPHREI